jgi:hypothetical protein
LKQGQGGFANGWLRLEGYQPERESGEKQPYFFSK